jgi:F1F0 ATPase subunit 2
MIPRPVTLTLLFIIGMGVGLVFFGGLWLTVRALPTAKYPTALALASFWGRTALTVVTFAWLLSRDWKSVLMLLLGFLGGRLVVARCVPRDAVDRDIVR